jgi:SNF2 family DNA or RNA helicase
MLLPAPYQPVAPDLEPLPVPPDQCLDDKQVAQVRTLLRIMRHGAAVGDGTAKGALLASEPGTGKTPMSITVVNALGGQRPFRVLIIANQNYRHVWVDHILKWQLPRRQIISVEAGDVHDLSVFTNAWCIINYEILDRFEESIRKKEWDLLIVDESHAAKNFAAKRTVQIYGGKWERKRIAPIPAVKTLIVTGTPILNYPYELYTALRHLDPAQWSRRYKAFVNEWYESDSLTTFTIDETLRVFGEPRDLDQFQRKLRNTVMVREYLEGLPPKIYEVKVIPPTDRRRYSIFLGQKTRVESYTRRVKAHQEKI